MTKKINKIINKAEIFLGRKKLWSRPRHVQLEPTNRCNQRCIMCPRNEKDYDSGFGDMSFDNYLKVLDQIPTITNLQINGLGEPLLHPKIFEMIKAAKERGIKVSMNSNAVLINSKDKAEELVKSGLDILKVSMDTVRPEVYREIRGVDNLEQAISAIKLIIEARGERKKPQVWFNSIILEQNYQEIGEILKLGEELGVDLVRFKPVDTFDIYKNKGIKVASQEQLFEAISKALDQTKNFKVKHNLADILNNFSNYYRTKGDWPCFSPWLEAYIQYYGGVRLCCEFYSRKYDIGNMFEADFKKIWNGKKMQGIRKDFYRGKTNFPVCLTCTRFRRNLEIYRKING